jgi:hypothetical protein
MDARHLLRRARVDGGDVGMGVRRAHDSRMKLIGEVEIVKKAALPPQQARVFAPQHRLSDGKFTHDLSEPAVVETPSLVRESSILRRLPMCWVSGLEWHAPSKLTTRADPADDRLGAGPECDAPTVDGRVCRTQSTRGEVDTAVARGRKQGSVFIAQEEIMELPGSAYLYTLATLSMTFAGFSAVVIVLCQTIGREISGFHVVLMRLYIEAGL